MKIELIGVSGCAKCKDLYERVKKVVEETQPAATITKVEDIMEIMEYCIIATPAVVIDGTVVMQGSIPKESEIREWLLETGKTDLKELAKQPDNNLEPTSDTATKCCYCCNP